jgi:predicted transposase/invertase (TIGR01784 family)
MQRTVFYQSAMFYNQLGIGQKWRQLKKVICIHILESNLYGDDGDYHDVHYFMSRNKNKRTYEVYEIHTIELKKFHKGPEDLTTRLDWLVYFLKNIPNYKKSEIPKVFRGHPELVKACKTLHLLSLNKKEMEEYRTGVTMMQSVEDIKRREGEKCRLEGRLEGQHSLLNDLMRRKFGNDIPADVFSMFGKSTEEEIPALCERIFVIDALKDLFSRAYRNKLKRTTPIRVSPRKRTRTAPIAV